LKRASLLVDFELVKRHRLYTSDDFWFEVDEYSRLGDQLLIAHVRIVRWSPAVRRECHRVWNAFRACVTQPIFTLGIEDDKKFERFVRSFGYRPFHNVTCENGETRRLFIHTI
jgi:hypothetical protein